MDGLRTYTYNDEGIRIAKNDRGTLHTYKVNGTQIVSETWGIHTIFYVYDENGSIAGMRYRTSNYAEGVFDEFLFEKNLQGDVVAIYNASGTKLVSYTYDAWGKVTTTYSNNGASTPARFNPFKYRGYYHDSDTNLYYLNSRYYDPGTGRFISADGYVSTGQGILGNNMYAYCGNNPVNRFDPTGHSWESFWNGVGDWFSEHWVELAIGTAFIIGGAVVTALTCGAGTTAWAAFVSALLSSAIQVGAGIGTGVLLNGVSNLIQGNDFFDNVGDTIASAYMLGGILSGGSQMLSGGFRFLRAKTGFKGIDSKNFGFMSADKLYYDKPGMTVLRLGSRNGAKLAIDFGRYGIHGHIWKWSTHIPLIPGIVGISELF